MTPNQVLCDVLLEKWPSSHATRIVPGQLEGWGQEEV